MRKRCLQKKLSEVLASPDLEECAVDELATHIADRVLWAVFDIKGLAEEEIGELKDALRYVAHWAIHIGQSAWQLKNIGTIPPLAHPTRVDLNIAVFEIYIRPFMMLGTETIPIVTEPFAKLISSAATGSEPLHADRQELRRLDRDASFTRLRLALRRNNGEYAQVMPVDAETPSSVLDEVFASLRRNADLYIHSLEWLVHTNKTKRSEISDCFVTLCALALNMAADAVRLRWPV